MKLTINKSALQDIENTVGSRPCETGGLLLGSRENHQIKEFYFDENGSGNFASYSPDVGLLNKVIKSKKEEGLEFMGMVHSHPPGVNRLSGLNGDLGYAEDIFRYMPSLDYLVTPILFSKADTKTPEFIPYVIERGNLKGYKAAELEIVDDSYEFDSSKIQGAVDYELMQTSKIVVVGTGGASGLCENLVRAGAENLVICDFDTVDASNLTTQGFTIDDIGEYKTEVLAERLKKIKPDVQVQSIIRDFTTLDEDELSEILHGTDLLLMMTDSFECQAFGNRVALNHSIPAIFAGMHERAGGCEVIYTIPGLTPNCFRCFTNARYNAHAQKLDSGITSQRSTIFDTEYLNCQIGKIALAILHRETEGLEYSDWFTEKVLSRNLIHTKLHPGYSSGKGNFFKWLFGRKKEFYTFVSAWRTKMAGEEVGCDDCRSTGDLKDSHGKFSHSELNNF